MPSRHSPSFAFVVSPEGGLLRAEGRIRDAPDQAVGLTSGCLLVAAHRVALPDVRLQLQPVAA
jgi:hypothetical protein